MGESPRKADGRRVFTVEFKRGDVQQLLTGEKTLAEVCRELDIQPSVIRQWKRRSEAGATAAVAANEDVVPGQPAARSPQRIRELERVLGQEADGDRDPAGGAGGRKKKSVVAQRVRTVTQHPVTAICQTLRMSPADGVLRRAQPAGGPLSAGRRRDRAPADPRRDEQPRHLRLSPRLGHGEPHLSRPATTASASGGSCGCTA